MHDQAQELVREAIERLEGNEQQIQLMCQWVRIHKPCGPELLAGEL